MNTSEISKLIERTGLKKQEVAIAIGVSVATLRRWEHGETAMPADKLQELKAIAGGKPAPRPLGSQKPATAVLAQVPAAALIEELARRTRSGQLKDNGSNHDTPASVT
ncbi:helix-turn-helix domain-containing protein [Pseudarthrobacter sp. ATCC 49987]|uniref:helix-turn-helix domain-containing protein n=1 Tax=Pseudarthrobacter sp. ATCC 49987 TaxID=2698204 RepID=UPI00136FFE50|nr:helix-turn-helix transcriptional regulator [Pseudarthrobacter sp. ATCC 49987]